MQTESDKESGQEQQRAMMTQPAQWKLSIKEQESPTLIVESAMGAHTLEVMAINSAPLSATNLKVSPMKEECELSSPSIHE